MKTIKLSVAITIFNEEKNIPLMLESLVNQSFKINEIIFCDGGSTDKTLEIISNYKIYSDNAIIPLSSERV